MAPELHTKIEDAVNALNALPPQSSVFAVTRCNHRHEISDRILSEAVSRRDVTRTKDIGIVKNNLSRALDQLHRAIVCGDVSEALDLLREIAPSHSFLTVRAESQLAIGRGEKVLI